MNNSTKRTDTMPATPLLKEAALRELFAAGTVDGIVARGITGGFVIEVTIAGAAVVLANSSGEARTFSSIEAMCLLVRKMGLSSFRVDFADFEPGRTRAAQPARSSAMKAGRLPKSSGTNDSE